MKFRYSGSKQEGVDAMFFVLSVGNSRKHGRFWNIESRQMDEAIEI